MPMNFTRKAYLEVWKGTEYISRHTSLVECAESASKEPGTYHVTIGGAPTRGVLSADGLHHTVPGNIYYEIKVPRADVSTYNVSADEPGGTDVTVQIAGGHAEAQSSAPSAQQSSNNVAVDIVGAAGLARGGNLPSQTLGYPKVGCSLIGGSQPWATNHPDAAYQLDGIQEMDFVMLASQPGKIPLYNDNANFRSIQNIIIDMKTRSPDQQIFIYVNTHETVAQANNSLTSAIYAGLGPPGAELFWNTQLNGKYGSGTLDSNGSDVTPIGPYASAGLPVNDWWARDSNGFKRSTFGGGGSNIQYNVNMAPGFAQVDGSGRLYPQVYFDEYVLPDILEPHLISNGGVGLGLTGANLFCDVTDEKPRSNTIDYNGDGRADRGRSVWDAFNSTHVNDPETATYGGGVYSAAGYRRGHRLFTDTVKAYNPDIQVVHNTVTWTNATGTDGPTAGVDVQPEYQWPTAGTSIPLNSPTPRQSFDEGFFSESMVKQSGFPVTGVGADGLDNGLGFPGPTQGWWIAYNQYRHNSEVSHGGNYSGSSGSTWCKERMSPDLNGQARWDWVPVSNSRWHVMRWLLCMALLDDGYFIHGGIQFGTTSTGSSAGAVLFDEFGSINQATTGLSRHYLGQPLEPKVWQPLVGSQHHGLMTREFEGGRVITTTSKQNNINVPVVAQGWSGLYKRINGFQDPGWNTGATVTSDFSMPPIDGIILVNV